MTRRKPTLPEPSTCTWLEAEQVAEVLEAFASEVLADIGTTVPTGIRNWKAAQRWRGKVAVASRARYAAMRYRLRQNDLRSPDDPDVVIFPRRGW